MLDEHDAPLALLDAASVVGQRLRHRVAVVALFDAKSRLLLQREPAARAPLLPPADARVPGSWELPWQRVAAGQSLEDAALALMRGWRLPVPWRSIEARGLSGALRVRDGLLEAATGQCVSLFRCRVPGILDTAGLGATGPEAPPATTLAPESPAPRREWLAVDRDELLGLHSHFGDMLSPWLRSLLLQGLLDAGHPQTL